MVPYTSSAQTSLTGVTVHLYHIGFTYFTSGGILSSAVGVHSNMAAPLFWNQKDTLAFYFSNEPNSYSPIFILSLVSHPERAL